MAPRIGNAPVGRLPAGFLFDGVERGDPFERLGRDRRALGGMDVEELAPHMRQAGDLADRAGAGELAEPGIAVAVHPAAEARQMRLRMFGLAVGREAVPRRRRGFAPARAVRPAHRPRPALSTSFPSRARAP